MSVRNRPRCLQQSNTARPSSPGSTSWINPMESLDEMIIRYEPEEKILWQEMKPSGRPSITPGLLRDAITVMDTVEHAQAATPHPLVEYMVLASAWPGAYNLGGDLALFKQLILAGDREGLRGYAHACIEVQYRRAIRMNLPVCTIALVQGDALGGGFEAALSHDVIVAERSAKFGLPEILFNLFPGMGAYSFLARRLGSAGAERLMTSGRLYASEELHQLGVVDVVAEDGTGVEAVYGYIDSHRRASKARLAIAQLKGMVAPVTREELLQITELWVETALTLDARDLRKMEHLIAAQLRRSMGASIGDDGQKQRISA